MHIDNNDNTTFLSALLLINDCQLRGIIINDNFSRLPVNHQ